MKTLTRRLKIAELFVVMMAMALLVDVSWGRVERAICAYMADAAPRFTDLLKQELRHRLKANRRRAIRLEKAIAKLS